MFGLVAAGCGGAGVVEKESLALVGRGRLEIRLLWPNSPTRVVPGATRTIRLEVVQGGTTVASALVASPATTASFPEMPTGGVSVRATAYSTTDGTGNPVAGATASATVTDAAATPVSITMATTIASITVAPSSFSIVLAVLGYRQLNVSAFNSSGQPVTVADSDLEYTTNRPLIAWVSTAGVVTGLVPGTATITVKELTSGLTKTVSVNVL